jgi:hypothetical protein
MEGRAMRSRCLLIASIAAVTGAAAGAEPAQPAAPTAREQAQPASAPKPVVLASADQVQTTPPGVSEQVAAPVKRPRAARVTTCRCGNQDQSVER